VRRSDHQFSFARSCEGRFSLTFCRSKSPELSVAAEDLGKMMLRLASAPVASRSEKPSIAWRQRDYATASPQKLSTALNFQFSLHYLLIETVIFSVASFAEYLSRKPVKFFNPGQSSPRVPKPVVTKLEKAELDPIPNRVKVRKTWCYQLQLTHI
jgi:hypothetical protein